MKFFLLMSKKEGSSSLSAALWGSLGLLCISAQKQLAVVQFSNKCGFFSGSPLAAPGHQGAVPMGPAPALVPSAGRDAGTPLLGWQRNMLPSIFLLKAGNKEG